MTGPGSPATPRIRFWLCAVPLLLAPAGCANQVAGSPGTSLSALVAPIAGRTAAAGPSLSSPPTGTRPSGTRPASSSNTARPGSSSAGQHPATATGTATGRGPAVVPGPGTQPAGNAPATLTAAADGAAPGPDDGPGTRPALVGPTTRTPGTGPTTPEPSPTPGATTLPTPTRTPIPTPVPTDQRPTDQERTDQPSGQPRINVTVQVPGTCDSGTTITPSFSISATNATAVRVSVIRNGQESAVDTGGFALVGFNVVQFAGTNFSCVGVDGYVNTESVRFTATGNGGSATTTVQISVAAK